MNFSLLSGSSLAMSLLVLGPLLAHLASRRPVQRRAFGAMMLLRRVSRKLRRRRRIRDPVLMILRMALVLLMVLAAAHPVLHLPRQPAELGSSGRLVVIVDNSMSMSAPASAGAAATGQTQDQSATLLSTARSQAAESIRRLPSGVQVGLVTTAGGPGSPSGNTGALRLTPTLTDATKRVARMAESIPPTFEATDLTGALRQSRALLAGEPGEVLVFSDEAGPTLLSSSLEEMERLLASGSTVIPRKLTAQNNDNLCIASTQYAEGIEGGSLKVQVLNFGSRQVEATLSVRLPDGREMNAFVDLPAAQEPAHPSETDLPGPPGRAQELFTIPPEVQGGIASVHVLDSGLQQDDYRYFHLPRVGASRVLLVEGDPGASPTRSETYFLERALAPWGGKRSGVTPDIIGPAGMESLDPRRHRVVILANVSEPGPLAADLNAFVRAGGGLVITCGDNILPQRYNSALGSLLPAMFRESRNLVGRNALGVSVQPPDTGVPFFSPFGKKGTGSFALVHFYRLMTFEPLLRDRDSRILLAMENGMPLLLESRVGRGRVLVLAGTVDLAWGNLPVQAVFVPLVQRIIAFLGAQGGESASFHSGTTGQTLSIPLPHRRLSPSVQGPDGNTVPSTVSGGRLLFTPRTPGAFIVHLPGSSPLAMVAVNTPAPESDLRPYGSLKELEASVDPTLFQSQVELGPWLLITALVLLLLQALVASKAADSGNGRRHAQSVSTAAAHGTPIPE